MHLMLKREGIMEFKEVIEQIFLQEILDKKVERAKKLEAVPGGLPKSARTYRNSTYTCPSLEKRYGNSL